MGFLFRILLFFSCKVCGSPQPCGPGADVPVPILGIRFRVLLFFSCKVCGSPQLRGSGADVPVPILGIRFRVLLVLFLQEKNKKTQSWRMASRALIRTALLAGRMPDTRPTRVANASAASISHGGITDTMVEDAP